jgi:hypothetical protein
MSTYLNQPILHGMSTPRGQAGSGGGGPTTPTYTVFLSEQEPVEEGTVSVSGFIDPGSSDVVLMTFLSSSSNGPRSDDDFEIDVVTGMVQPGSLGAIVFFTPDSNGNFSLNITALNGVLLPLLFVTSGGASHTTMASVELDFT